MKVLCTTQDGPIPDEVDQQFLLFGNSSFPNVGSAAATLVKCLRKQGAFAPQIAWDLLSVGLAVEAADQACPRNRSSDGWTRIIDVTIPVQDETLWRSQEPLLSRLLRFLTGDIWTVEFSEGGIAAEERGTRARREEQCVCLLSGGADSLTGAIDLRRAGERPLFVSQVSKGDKDTQKDFSGRIAGAGHHIQLNHNINTSEASERSQRARSFLFLAYGAFAATGLERYEREEVNLFVPENGFISLNVPLTPLRVGSLSTRTTHPYYLFQVQQLLNAIGLMVTIKNPFQFKTKGEMFVGCSDQALLMDLVFKSTSCGRYARTGFMHCGRCVPCIIRRAAMHAWNVSDATEYRYADLSINDEQHRQFDDVKSAAFAIERVRTSSVDSWIGGFLNFPGRGDVSPYRDVLRRGLSEVEGFFRTVGAT